MKHNNQLPNQHLRKEWQSRVRTWFDQPGRKLSRRRARIAKAAKVAPRPVDLLRPAVRCPTIKYNRKVRAGRGFTLEELKAAGVNPREALSIGIAVDTRRRNRSEESLNLNVQRLKAYKAKLIVLPRSGKKRTPESVKEFNDAQKTTVLPSIEDNYVPEAPRAITADEKKARSYQKLRHQWSSYRTEGIRAARAKAKAEEAEQKLKK
ncbi:60S ribosomal protein L13 [Mycoemilia scoparia]|uniref:60S ribosomal protein L13 n=1 Tax=Mycoemilia scoparia TaxID=417184 RepID=A0A9W8DMQ9_9FUNG|nr:60S ribosomal protein L13 [Mycoemilia scoparia]